MLTKTFQVAAVAIIAALVAVGASPLQARGPAYGGIGATIADFRGHTFYATEYSETPDEWPPHALPLTDEAAAS